MKTKPDHKLNILSGVDEAPEPLDAEGPELPELELVML